MYCLIMMYYVIIIICSNIYIAVYVQEKHNGARTTATTGAVCHPLGQSTSGQHRGHPGMQSVSADQGKQPGVSHFTESGGIQHQKCC